MRRRRGAGWPSNDIEESYRGDAGEFLEVIRGREEAGATIDGLGGDEGVGRRQFSCCARSATPLVSSRIMSAAAPPCSPSPRGNRSFQTASRSGGGGGGGCTR